jgi:DNA primase
LDKIPKRRTTVREAAEELGISEDAVRQRIRRGSLESEKDDDGRIYIWLDVLPMSAEYSPQAIIASKDEIIEMLKQEVADWKEEARRKDTIIAQMNVSITTLTERIPIESPVDSSSEASDSPVTASEEESKGQVPPDQETATQESWWRRLFR